MDTLFGTWVPDRANTENRGHFGRSCNKKVGFSLFIFLIRFYYALEWLSDAGSAPIRTALRFCFDIYVRFFSQLFFKNIFWSIEKNNFWKKRKLIWSEKKSAEKNVRPKNIFWSNFFLAWIYSCEIFGFFSFHFSKFFIFWKYYFPEKINKKSESQGRSKISLRIEWEHSQPLKATLKHRSGCNMIYL